MLSFVDTGSSGGSSPVSPGGSYSEEEDPSVLQILKDLDIATLDETDPIRPFDQPKVHLSLPRISQPAGRKPNPETEEEGLVTKSFLQGRSQWVDDPVIARWREPSCELRSKLETVDQLYQKWRQSPLKPFDPFFDKIWLETATALQSAALPWHNNNLNMPEEVDTSWPFNFKNFERAAILAKGRRVSDPDASGYITNWIESNYYGIRALKQELAVQRPGKRPILLTHHFESEIAHAASKFFGVEWHKIVLEESEALHSRIRDLTAGGERPIIFAATLGNTEGDTDDMHIVDMISKRFPLLLHLDACRVFDYLTTADDALRQLLRLPRLRLHRSQVGTPGCIIDGDLCAGTIVAGGSNAHVFPPPVVVLKPKLLGNQAPTTVEYVRGTDSTLAGSRDALGPLIMCLQELRFGVNGLRDIYESCALKRLRLVEGLRSMNVSFSAHRATLDLKIFTNCLSTAGKLVELGAQGLGEGWFLLTVQPSAQLEDFEGLLGLFGCKLSRDTEDILSQRIPSIYRLADEVTKKIWDTVQDFKIAARSSCGYPLNQTPYSALGPAIVPFLTLKIPQEWSRVQAADILRRRMRFFGLLTPESQEPFAACFTTGSTMGNRVGLHNALAQYPGAFVYYSSASHYSVKKTVRDCDDLSNRWKPGRAPRFSEIPADEYGRMVPQLLVRQVLADRAECISHHDTFRVILFANFGTTFVGGRDNLIEIGKQLAEVEASPSYIHVDGALDFGFLVKGVSLGPPGALCTDEGIPIVQGITLSHHKAYGIMVSGEVIGYCPNSSEQFSTATSSVDPRAVFETWLFHHLYSDDDLVSVWQYCLENAASLRRVLAKLSIPTRFNEGTIITLLERPPPWIIKEFQLAPEGDWVHFITMPHISPATVMRFARAVALIDIHCATAFDYVQDSLITTLRRRVKLQRLTCRSPYVSHALAAMHTALVADPSSPEIAVELGLTQPGHAWGRFICGAMSFVAVNDEDEVQVVFLAEAEQQRVLKPRIVLFRPTFDEQVAMLRDVAIQLFGHVAELMDVRVDATGLSYRMVQYTA